MNIRKAEIKDLVNIAELWEEIDKYNRYTLGHERLFRNNIVGGKNRYINLLNEFFKDENFIAVICENESKLIGFVTCFLTNKFGNGLKDATIDVTFVNESFRGQNVGKRMYIFLENLLKEKGVIGITTEVFENNEASIKFHEKMGYYSIAKAIEMYKKL